MDEDKERARLAIANLEADLVARRGLRQAWNAIDDHALKCEILGHWIDIVLDAVADARANEREACAVAVNGFAERQWEQCEEADDGEESEVYEHCAGMLENARNAIRARGAK